MGTALHRSARSGPVPPGRRAGGLLLRQVAVLLVALAIAAGVLPAGVATAGPVVKPGAPTAVAATTGDGEFTLSWRPPTSGGPVEYYEVSYYTGREPRVTVRLDPGTLWYHAGGLKNDVVYYGYLRAANSAGHSSEAIAAKPRVTPPGEFALTSLTKQTGAITVGWSESAAGTYPIGRYTVFLYAGYRDALASPPVVARSTTVTPNQARLVTFTNLNPAWTYFVRVVASDTRSTGNPWPVDKAHQRVSSGVNGWNWSIRPS